jgi:hypothetical protein
VTRTNDGTIIWTSPTGHTYTTHPGSAMMPTRRHTRAHNTAKAITAERRINDPLVAERNKRDLSSWARDVYAANCHGAANRSLRTVVQA